MMELNMYKFTGSFAENKDVAQKIRVDKIIPSLEKNEDVVLDFRNIDSATQSFIHALISDVIRKNGSEILDRLMFKNCNETIKKIIIIVTEYMQES